MNTHTQERGDYRFVMGLLAGAAVGAGLALWFAPRAGAELRQRLTRSVRDLREQASERYAEASSRAGDAVDEIARTGQGVRRDIAEAVAHGAHEVGRGAREVERGAREVERYAVAAKHDAKKHSA